MYPVVASLSRTENVRLLNFLDRQLVPIIMSSILPPIISHSYVKYFLRYSYVKFLTCQEKPSKLPEVLTYSVCNTGFRQDFW